MKRKVISEERIMQLAKEQSQTINKSYKYLETTHYKWDSEKKIYLFDGEEPKTGRPKKK